MSFNKYISLSLISALLLAVPVMGAAPVLIEIDLENRAHFDYAKSLAISPWARWGNLFLAEIEEEELSLLTEKNIDFELISRFPKTQKNYLVSPEADVEPSFSAWILGKPVLGSPGLVYAQLDSGGVDLVHSWGYVAIEIGQEPIPFTYVQKIEVRKPSLAVLDWIQDLVDQVSQETLLAYNQRLQDFQTRYSYSDSIASARQWLVDKFTSYGIDSVYLDHYFYDSDQWNVVATIPGTVEPDALIVVGGHYDSVTYNQSPGPMTYAPGADDNGSGTAATLELARILANNPLPLTVVFIPFAQEEQGLRGSNAYAAEAFSRGDDIRFMLNMDMIGYKPNSTNVRLYHDPPSLPAADLMVSLASTYAGLTGIKGSASGNSDHWPFMQRGWKAVFAHEYIFNNQGWHKNTDLVDSMNFTYMTKVVKLALATIASLSQSPCQDFVGDPNNDNSTTLADVIHLVNYVFNKPGGPWTFDPFCQGDVNGDGSATLSDVIHLVNFIFGKPGNWAPVPNGGCCAF